MDSDGEAGSKAIAVLQLSCRDPQDSLYSSSCMMESQIEDLQVFALSISLVSVFFRGQDFFKQVFSTADCCMMSLFLSVMLFL